MRMPIAKVWRAFSELDRFDDDRCRVYVAEARSRRRTLGVVLFAVGSFAAVVFLVITGALAGSIQDEIPNEIRYDALSLLVSLSTGVVWLVALTAVVLLVRDAWLRSAIRDRLNTMTCGACRYSLLGLTPRGEAGSRHVVCPECGASVVLTPEMLEQLEALGVGSA